MDNLTHGLLGLAVGSLGWPDRDDAKTRTGRATVWASVIAAELPDLDVFYGRGNPLAEFQYHRGITHSFLLAPVVAAVAAALTKLVFRKGRLGPLYLFSEEGFAGTTYRERAERLLRTFDEKVAEFQVVRNEQSSPDVTAALDLQLSPVLEKVGPLRATLSSAEGMDAALWLEVDRKVNAALAELSAAIWEARIQALLD